MASDVVETVRRMLKRRQNVRLALVFGSVVRGTTRAEPDVDLAVDAPGVDRLALALDLWFTVGREVDVVDLGDAGYPLLASIVRDGVVVAEHASGVEARWRTRALLVLGTDRPWFARVRDAYLERLAAGGQ